MNSGAQRYRSLPYALVYAYTVGAGDVHTQLTYHSGRVVTNTFDPRLRLASVFDNAALANGVRWDFDAANRREKAIFNKAGQTARGESAFTYDLNNRLLHVEHGSRIDDVLQPFYELAYGYDALGNRLFKQDFQRTSRSEVYSYDQRHRLVEFDRGTIQFDGGGLASIATPLDDSRMPSNQNWMPAGLTGLDARGNWLDFTSTKGGELTTQARSLDDSAGGEGCANQYERIDMTRGSQHSIHPLTRRGRLRGRDRFAVCVLRTSRRVKGSQLTYDEAGNLVATDLLGDMNP
ncbi:MAG: hypothetical protein GX547_04255 [Phycisphaerae bacterium]|nr:hypothetical protein [Phycisphaerae bacterium]